MEKWGQDHVHWFFFLMEISSGRVLNQIAHAYWFVDCVFWFIGVKIAAILDSIFFWNKHKGKQRKKNGRQ